MQVLQLHLQKEKERRSEEGKKYKEAKEERKWSEEDVRGRR